MAMGCAGDPNVQTPALDRLAEQGVRCRHAYANDPVCGPSRASLLSGRYPTDHGVVFNGMGLPTDLETIGTVFRDAGYQTGYIGKWHLAGPDRGDGWIPPGAHRQGFEDEFCINRSTHDYFDGIHYGDDPEPVTLEGYTPAAQTDRAIDFVDAHRDEPFCLMLSWGPPHAPRSDVPQEYRDRYDPDALELRPNVEPIAGAPPPGVEGNPIRETIADSYAQTTAIDDQLDRLLRSLEATGQREDTIVVYTADHGDMLWSNGLWGKAYPFEESVNVPFLIRWPGQVPQGVVSDGLLGIVDVAPTLASLSGIEPPPGMQGQDRSEVLLSPETDADDAIGPVGEPSLFLTRTCTASLHTTDRPPWRGIPKPEWRGIRTQRYTYARLYDGSDWLLYDNAADPYQRRNLVSDPEHADVRERCSATLDAWLDELDDPFDSGAEIARSMGRLGELNRVLTRHGLEPVEE
jgi:arylsulfatase A-like enzyme